MQVKNNLLWVLIIVLSVSCAKSYDTDQEMVEYIQDEDNSYVYKKTIGNVEYTLQYRPTDLLVNQELRGNKDPKKIEELRKKYKKNLYFNLSMSQNSQEVLNNLAGDQQAFAQMADELIFRIGEKVHLFTPAYDTLAMRDFVYPRMYGATKTTTIMFVYPRDKEFLSKEYLNFTIEDFVLSTG